MRTILRKLICVITSLMILSSCESNVLFHNKQVIESPSGKLKAIVLDNGALLERDKAYKIYVTLSGEEEKIGHEVFKSGYTSDLKVSWKGDDTLEISFLKATIAYFVNVYSFYIRKKIGKDYTRQYLGSVIIKIPETTWENVANVDIVGREFIKGVK